MVNESHENFLDSLLRILSEKYPTKESIYEKLIYLQSRLSLPKGTEHFMSDLHGEYDLFSHIINNCSGVIHEKVDFYFGVRLTTTEKAEFCTLIYYPEEKIKQIKSEGLDTADWYLKNLSQLLELSKFMAYKYPSFKVREFIPHNYASIIIELMNTRPESEPAQLTYHKKLLDSIVAINSGEDFIKAFTVLIKRLAVDRLHFVGDFFDRGNRPDAILNLMMTQPVVDIQWGNHDVVWMGAAMGSGVCAATVVRNSLHYNNTEVLERGYGISLRPLTLFASNIYPNDEPLKAAEKAIEMIMFKLEGQLIRRNPDFKMEGRLLLDKINFDKKCVTIDGKDYALNESATFPTIQVDAADRYALTDDEQKIIDELTNNFMESSQLKIHLDYLYQKGSVYTCHNGNLLFHACVPLNEDGSFKEISFGKKNYAAKNYFDYVDQRARQAYLKRHRADLDFMYFLWCGLLSPIAGREFHTFERAFLNNEEVQKEPADFYFDLINDEKICDAILEEFGLDAKNGHIINGHVPVKVRKGESPIKANGKAFCIDGGFSRPYHKKTGISGYTLIFNSGGMRLLQHEKIADIKTALKENKDIESNSEIVSISSRRLTVGDTDHGKKDIHDEIIGLHKLLEAYQSGRLQPK
ncbi:MAG: fructose-1,6-bisphosphatase [Selenomonadaceae bacterium]|nr:fructose-1,6-bisphosphatase [Selenomonadaceae bacterium]